MSEYEVFRVDDENKRLGRIGRIALDEKNELSILKAEPAAEADLREAVEEVNTSDALFWKHTTDEVTKSGRSAITKEEIGRDDPRFVRAVQDNLQRWHAMELDLPPEAAEESDEDEIEDETETE